MKSGKYILVTLLLLFNITNGFAQGEDPQKTAILQQRIELIAEAYGDENPDFNTLFDALSNYYEHPANLNHTSKDELEELMMLTEMQIVNLLDHIEKNGKLISIYELQAIDGWDIETIRNILPFVYVADNFNTPHISIKQMLKEGTHEWSTRYVRILEPQAGYAPVSDSALTASPNSRYLGNPDRYYTRYRFRFGTNVSWGITAEKDPGEQFFKGTQKQGFDFYSGHFMIRNYGKIKALAIGDYQVSFGQGLTFSTGLAFGKNANTLNLKRNSSLVRPYTSAMENQFLRGGVISVDLKKFEFTLLYSRLKSDGNQINTSDTSQTAADDGIVISSLQNSGLHTTPAEIADKDIITVSNYGGHLMYKTRRFNLGTTAVYSDFGADLQKEINYYNQFDFHGRTNFVAGVDFSYVLRNANFFGEISRSQNGGMAAQLGMITSLDPKFSLAVLYRNYQRNYQSLYTNALAEASKATNEKGLYIGIEARFSAEWTLNAYFDTFESLWLRTGVSAPMRGYETLAQLNWRPNKKTDFYWRFRRRDKPYNTINDIDGIDYLVDRFQNNYRFQSTVKVSESLTLKNRVEVLTVNAGDEMHEKGFLIYQDVLFKPLSSPVSFTARYALFNTDSYNSRIYAYENEVLYFYSIPAYYYAGSRIYGIVHYKFRKRFDIWVRIGQWLYNNKNVTGSGLSEIDTNHKTEVKVQLRLSF